MSQATAEQLERGIIAAITSEPAANLNWREMSHDQLREQGYVIRIGNESEGEYRSDPCKFASLNPSTAKILVRECADYAWRQHPKGGAVRREATPAMDAGSLYDQLLTADEEEDDELALIAANVKPIKGGGAQVWERYHKQKKETERVTYTDVDKFRVIDVDAFQSAIAKEVAADARAKRIIPIKRKDFDKATQTAVELQVRLELAGIDLQAGDRQVPVYWVEFADDGTPVQCRGMLDQLDEWLIRDLKKTESLRLPDIARQVWNLGMDIQAAGYLSALEHVTGEYGRFNFEWAFIHTGKMVSARKVPIGASMLHMGRARWRYAINRWAKCMREGFWPGYELDPQKVEAEPYMQSQVEALGMMEEV